MKKLVFLTFLFALFPSCSSGDSATPSGAILVKRIVETDPAGVFTFNYTYNGNKMVESVLSATNYIRRGVYTYTGDLITKTEFFDISNTLVESDVYNYNSNNLLESYVKLNYNTGTGARVTYTYNADGSISSIGYSGDLINQDTVASHNTITLGADEIFSHDEDLGTITKRSVFIYDTKNNPFKNVTGYNKLAYARIGSFSSAINHNLTECLYTENGLPVSTTYYHLTYNSNDFPTTLTAGSNTNAVTYYYY